MALTKQTLGTQGDISFAGNTFKNFEITRLPDHSCLVEQNFDLQQLFYHTPDGQTHPLKGAAAHIKVTFRVSPSGKVLKAKPEVHVKWPGLGQALSTGNSADLFSGGVSE